MTLKKCSCGFETENRCRVHPARPAHIMVFGLVWLCHDCFELLRADPTYDHDREYAIARFLEKRFVLCPGCAYEAALFEDAQRELENFLSRGV